MMGVLGFVLRDRAIYLLFCGFRGVKSALSFTFLIVRTHTRILQFGIVVNSKASQVGDSVL